MTQPATRTRFNTIFLTTGVAACLALLGCQAPRGDDGGRVGVYETGRDERSRQPNLADMTQFSDDTVDTIVTELAGLKQQLDPNVRYALYVGELVNQTTATSTREFEMFQARVRSRLVNEPRIRDVFAIRNDPTGAIRQARRVAAPPPANDVAQPGLAGMDVAVDPRYQFVLSGAFYDAVRNGRSQFFLNFTVVNVATGDIVISVDKDLKQVTR